MNIKRILGPLLAFAALATVATLGGCGDSDNDEPPSRDTGVPASAAASISAYVAFLTGLGGADETSDPLSLEGFTPPADETSEPT